MKNGFAILCLLTVAATNLFSRENAFRKISGPYLGQKPPGLTPEIFAPGIVCCGMMERDVAITADGSEIYFGVSFGNVVTIMWTRLWQGRWSEPEVAPFATDANYFHFEPALSADGKRIFFLSNRPGKGQEAKPGWAYEGIWAANRRPDGSWGEPYDPFPALNGEAKQFFPSLTREGTLYFTRVDRQAKKPAIYRSRPFNGEYATAEKLPDAVNGKGTPYNAFIARDESYLIACVDGRPYDANPGEANYFIFFRDKDDHWSDGIPLGPEVNMKGSTAMSPYVSPDGKYLFFAAQKTADRFRGMLMGRTLSWLQKMKDSCQNGDYDIYWVDAGIIEPLRLQALAASAPAVRQAGREPLILTRIANSGVMLASGRTKVLIDALFDMPPADYRSPAPEVLEKIMKGTVPFDGIDLAFITHNHPDHFAAPLAVRYLEASPGTTVIAPEDAVAEMRKEAGWTKIAPRVIPMDLKIDEEKKLNLSGISLTACRTMHSGKREAPMNLMYLLQFNGWNVFHEGDADATLEEYRGFGLEGTKIDLALVHFWFPLHPEMAKLLQDVLKPDHIGLTHLPIRLENDAPGKIDMVRQYYNDIFLLLPGLPAKEICDASGLAPGGKKAEDAFSILKGPYLGQKPPGMMPEIFAPGIISTDQTEYTPAFTPEQDDCFYTVFLPSKRHAIMRLRQIDGIWRAPEPAPFCGSSNDADLTLSADGRKALFWSDRPLAAGETKNDADLWTSTKKNGEWQPAQWLNGAVNNRDWQIAPTETAAGAIYFAANRFHGKDYMENLGKMDIYRSDPINGVYGAPKNLGTPVNTPHQEKEPFVAPDESYLIFTSDRPGGFGDCDLYVSFKKEDGSWSEPLNMGGSINSVKWEGVPIVSSDGKYLFFSSDRGGNSDVYWVDCGIIAKLKQDHQRNGGKE